MSSGDFLLIVPPGWIKLANAEEVLYLWGPIGTREMIERGAWGELEGFIEAVGQLPADMTLAEARFIDTAVEGPDRYQVWFRFQPWMAT